MTGRKSFFVSEISLRPLAFSLPVGLSLTKVHYALNFTISDSFDLSLDIILKSLMNLRKLGGEIVHYESE